MSFTIDRVSRAYEAAKIQPTKGLFTRVRWDDEGEPILCGCAVTALLIAECDWSFGDVVNFADGDMPLDRIAKQLGVEENYLYGFIAGFDDLEMFRPSDKLLQSWEDGNACFLKIINNTPDESAAEVDET